MNILRPNMNISHLKKTYICNGLKLKTKKYIMENNKINMNDMFCYMF